MKRKSLFVLLSTCLLAGIIGVIIIGQKGKAETRLSEEEIARLRLQYPVSDMGSPLINSIIPEGWGLNFGTIIAAAWNVLDFIPGEQYLFLITPFKSEEELELITDYSYYITEDEHVVAAIYDDGEEYTGYSLENFEKQVTDRIKVYEEEKKKKN